MSLRKKILVPTIILIVLVMAGSRCLNYYCFSRSLNEKVVGQLSAIAESKVELIDNWIEQMEVLTLASPLRSVYGRALQKMAAEA